MGFAKFVGVKLLWAIFGIICCIAGIIVFSILDELFNIRYWIVGLIIAYIFLRCWWEEYERKT